MIPDTPCRLCSEPAPLHVEQCFKRDLFRCRHCDLTQVAPAQLPNATDEFERYNNHNNSLENDGYRAFLEQFIAPVLPRIDESHEGLDYGCGPGAPLTQLLTDQGYSCTAFDPFFHFDASVFSSRYDFILCCEVVEHFHRPANDFAILKQRLRPGGLLAIRTAVVTPDTDFTDWAYARDKTHVSFYSQKTLSWISRRFELKIVESGENYILYQN